MPRSLLMARRHRVCAFSQRIGTCPCAWRQLRRLRQVRGGVPPAPVVPSYDPFGAEQVREVTVTVKSKSPGKCDVALSFQRPALPPVMTRWSSTLQYAIEGRAAIRWSRRRSGATARPATASTSSICARTRRGRQRCACASLRARCARPATTPTTMSISFLSDSTTTINRTASLCASASGPRRRSSPSACYRRPIRPRTTSPAPSRKGCPIPRRSAPARSRTFSARHRRKCASSEAPCSPRRQFPRSGFDNFINWRAAATFGNAIALLSTNTASQADSQYKNVATARRSTARSASASIFSRASRSLRARIPARSRSRSIPNF